jgi:hypothetical protein
VSPGELLARANIGAAIESIGIESIGIDVTRG